MATLLPGQYTGTLYATLGLVLGAVLSLVSLLGGFASAGQGGAALAATIGAGAIILVSVIYGGIGFVATLITAWLYNGVSKLVGGVRMEVE